MKKATRLVTAISLSACGLLSAWSACSKGSDSIPWAQSTTALSSRATAAARVLSGPAWATSDRFVGHVDADQSIAIQVHLAMRSEKAAEAELAAISDPQNSRYGQFLSSAEYLAKYAPTPEDVTAVRAYLQHNGLRVLHTPSNLTYIAAQGTAVQLERIFSTRLGLYQVGSELRRAPVGGVKIPDELQTRVRGVLGLTTVRAQPNYLRARDLHGSSSSMNRRGSSAKKPQPADVPGDTCSEWYGQLSDTFDAPYPGYAPLTYIPCGFIPAQIRAAYGFSKAIHTGNDGTGQSVAIVDAWLSPTLEQDAQTYAANHDPDYPLLSAQFSSQMAPGTPQTPDPGWYTEQSLDVESVHTMAPGANIVYVGAQSDSDTDLIAADNLIIEKSLASIISNSWAWPEPVTENFVVFHSMATQAGLKGIGLYYASGDAGDNSGFSMFGIPISPMFPASLDNVTAVGGTSLALSNSGALNWETGWENGFSALLAPNAGEGASPDGGLASLDLGTGALDLAPAPPSWDPAPPGLFNGGAGGGVSVVYDQPTWQAGVVPDSIASSGGAPARAVPDVALLADPTTGLIIGFTDPDSNTYVEGPVGGTSLATPLFSAAMALAQQSTKKQFGFANPLLYKDRATAFRDVVPLLTQQAVAIPDVEVEVGATIVTTDIAINFGYPNLTISTTAGWDTVTGLGVPNGATFLTALAK